jgi:hypothetical protein
MTERKTNRMIVARRWTAAGLRILAPIAAIALAIALLWSVAVRQATASGNTVTADQYWKIPGERIEAPVCHDGLWEPGEYCGRDAYVVTNSPDMNHDCVVDWLDQGLFSLQVGSAGPNLSGDFNDSNMVDATDAATFGANYGETATPCTRSGVGKEQCRGSIALSFDANPNNIVPTLVLGAPGIVTMYMVCSGWSDARALEFSLRATGNVSVVGTPGGTPSCTHAGSKQYYRTIYNTPAWGAGPVVVGSFTLNVADLNPVTLELRPFTGGACTSGQRLRWTDSAFNRSVDFASVGNAAINGAAPAGSPTCTCPVITSIVDVGNDQGRQVRVALKGSYYDAAGAPALVLQYEAFRRIDALPKPGTGVTLPSGSGWDRIRLASQRGMMSDPTILLAGWEFVESAPAHQEAAYNLIAPTLADSTVEDGIFRSVFFMRAATANAGIFFDSAPDSGYSRDNLAPNVPLGFLVSGVTGSDVHLSWNANTEPDFRYYTLYRGTTPTFVPSVSNRIAGVIANSYVNVGASVAPYHYYYKLSATDFGGNESPFAATEFRVSGVGPGGDLPVTTSFRTGSENPVRDGALVLYDLPSKATVSLHVYDARGRLVRTVLENASVPGGRYRWEWDLRDGLGVRVSPGIYFQRFEAGDFAETVKTVVVQ